MRTHLSLLIILFLGLGLFNGAFAQYRASVSGYIYNSETGMLIKSANIKIGPKDLEVESNEFGFYYAEVPTDTVQIEIRIPGFLDYNNKFYIEKDTAINFYIQRDWVLEGVQNNHASKLEGQLLETLSNKIDVVPGTIKDLPYLLSTEDVVKGIQMLPGVDFGADGGSDLYIRGGESGQNLILYDGAPVYGYTHVYGFLSIFDPEVIDNMQIYKGGAPARFGGGVSGVVDISPSSGNSKDVSAHLNITPVMLGANASIPIQQTGGSISLNMRRSYIDLLLRPFISDLFSFGDVQTKISLPQKNGGNIEVSYLLGTDLYSLFLQDTGVPAEYNLENQLKNHTLSLRYTKQVKRNVFGSFLGYYTSYSERLSSAELLLDPQQGDPRRSEIAFNSGIKETGLKGELAIHKNQQHLYRVGFQTNIKMLNTGSLTEQRFDIVDRIIYDKAWGQENSTAFEAAFYGEDEWTISSTTKARLGLRLPIYLYKGHLNVLPEPRLYIRKKLDEKASLNASYAMTQQFLHLYNNGSTLLSNIIWIPATSDIKPERSHQLNLGLTRIISESALIQTELYWRTVSNQASYLFRDLQTDLGFDKSALIGNSYNYGLETTLKRTHGNFTGWLGYTLSWSNRVYNDLNAGLPFPSASDRRHQFKTSWVFTAPSFVFSTNFVLATGNPFSLPLAKYRDIEGRTVLSYGEINNYRSKAYIRTDVKLTYFWGNGGKTNHSIDFSLYNLTGRSNVANVYALIDEDAVNDQYTAYQESYFKFIPGVAYRLTL